MFERILRDFTRMQVLSFDEAALARFNDFRKVAGLRAEDWSH